MWDKEKFGGVPKERKFLEQFREVLDDCNLMDMPFKGSPFTWWNRRKGDHVWEILDRFICNATFEKLGFPLAIQYLDWTISDHRPIEISCNNNPSNKRINLKRTFKFEEF